jgi:hypothetical protein
MAGESAGSGALELTRRLFVPRERWGWEYVDPEGPGPDPARKPYWVEPSPPDTRALEERRRRLQSKTPVRLTAAAILMLLSIFDWGQGWLFLPFQAFFLVSGALLATRHLRRLWAAKREYVEIRQAAADHRADQWRQYQVALAAWQDDVRAHEAAVAQRRSRAQLFFPLGPRSAPARLDVFGGTGDGWASLLATAGASVLAAGSGVLLLDLSERSVGEGLAVLADAAGHPVEVDELPVDLGRLGLLADLPADDVADALADAFDSARRTGDDPSLRALDADLLAAVARCLDGPPSFAALAAGLRVLARIDEPGGQPSSLSPEEAGRILGRADLVGTSPRAVDELQYLRTSLEALADAEEPTATATATSGTGPGVRAAAAGLRWSPPRGLRVLATSSRDTSARRKDLTDRVLFQVVLHQLRRRRAADTPMMLVVAGADHLGRAGLEAMARHAEISGVRLVYMFERLAGDGEPFLGGGGSASVLMRLGNAREAAAAAEFIGRGHVFVLSQLTEQIGKSFSTSDASSVGGQTSVSETEGTSRSSGGVRAQGGIFSRLAGSHTSKGWNRSVTVSRSSTWERTHSISEGDQLNRGATLERSYEFTVEPTAIQQLPPTAFVLVDPAGLRRAVSGDCNPGIVLLPRVGDQPYVPGADATQPVTGAAGRPQGALPAAGAGQGYPLPAGQDHSSSSPEHAYPPERAYLPPVPAHPGRSDSDRPERDARRTGRHLPGGGR